eukprot:203272_1
MDEDYIIYDDDDDEDDLKKSDESLDAANSVRLNDVDEAAEYLQTMENKITTITDDETSAADINVNISNQNSNSRKRTSNVAISEEPPAKKHRVSNNSNTNHPTKQSLFALSVKLLKEKYLRPLGLKVGGKKAVLIDRILHHYAKEDKMEMDDELDTINVVESHSTDSLSDKACVCGAMFSHMKIRQIYRNRNYIKCTGICQEKITNGRKFVYHCHKCLKDICEDCLDEIL